VVVQKKREPYVPPSVWPVLVGIIICSIVLYLYEQDNPGQGAWYYLCVIGAVLFILAIEHFVQPTSTQKQRSRPTLEANLDDDRITDRTQTQVAVLNRNLAQGKRYTIGTDGEIVFEPPHSSLPHPIEHHAAQLRPSAHSHTRSRHTGS
jgi:hypothetical protein